MTGLEIDKANEQMRSLVIVMNSHEYKSGTYLYIRDKIDYFCEFMALFGYEWCEDDEWNAFCDRERRAALNRLHRKTWENGRQLRIEVER